MKPVLDEEHPLDEANGLGRMGSANLHSDSGDDASNSHHALGISLHGDTVSGGPPGQSTVLLGVSARTPRTASALLRS